MRNSFFGVLLFYALLVGCEMNGSDWLDDDVLDLTNSDDEELYDGPTGFIDFSFPEIVNRTVLDSTVAQNNCDFYQYLIYNSDGIYTGSSDDPVRVKLPVGSYNIVVLAGTGSVVMKALLGSGNADAVQVIQDETTAVSVSLYPVSVSITADDEVYTDHDITFTVEGDTGNDRLSYKGDLYVYNITVATLSPVLTSISGRTFSGSGTVSAPSSEGSYIYYLQNTTENLYLTDTSEGYEISQSLSSFNSNMMDWYGFVYDPYYTSSLQDILSQTVTVTPDPTGIAVTTSWGS